MKCFKCGVRFVGKGDGKNIAGRFNLYESEAMNIEIECLACGETYEAILEWESFGVYDDVEVEE